MKVKLAIILLLLEYNNIISIVIGIIANSTKLDLACNRILQYKSYILITVHKPVISQNYSCEYQNIDYLKCIEICYYYTSR